jgi:hypothetical protein
MCFELERHFSVETDSIVSSFVRRKKLVGQSLVSSGAPRLGRREAERTVGVGG